MTKSEQFNSKTLARGTKNATAWRHSCAKRKNGAKNSNHAVREVSAATVSVSYVYQVNSSELTFKTKWITVEIELEKLPKRRAVETWYFFPNKLAY